MPLALQEVYLSLIIAAIQTGTTGVDMILILTDDTTSEYKESFSQRWGAPGNEDPVETEVAEQQHPHLWYKKTMPNTKKAIICVHANNTWSALDSAVICCKLR